jgi:hypothetical protein
MRAFGRVDGSHIFVLFWSHDAAKSASPGRAGVLAALLVARAAGRLLRTRLPSRQVKCWCSLNGVSLICFASLCSAGSGADCSPHSARRKSAATLAMQARGEPRVTHPVPPSACWTTQISH